MRKIIDALSIFGIFAAIFAVGLVYTQTHASQATAQTEEFPPDKPQIINFEADESFKRLSNSQQLDQLRDWLLLTVIAGKGLSTQEIKQSIYDLPPVRYDYMSPVSNFKYGTTRSRYIRNGRIVALVLKATSSAERMNDLAHIVSRHRQNQAKVLEVFEYEIVPDKLSALLTRYKNVEVKQISSSIYNQNYVQTQSLENIHTYINNLGISIEPIPIPREPILIPREPIPIPREPIPIPREPIPIPGEDEPIQAPVRKKLLTHPEGRIDPTPKTKPIFNSRKVSPSVFKVNADLQGIAIGTLNIDKTINGFTVGFQGRDIDRAYSLKSLLSTDNQPIETVLKNSEDVEVVMKSNTQQSNYIVKLSNSEHWLRINKQSQPEAGSGLPPSKPPKNSLLPLGDSGDDSGKYTFSWLNEAEVKQKQNAGDLQKIYPHRFEGEDADLQFRDIVQNLKYQEVVQGIANEPIRFFLLKERYFKVELKKIDSLLKAGKDTKAAQQIKNLIKFYGPEPNLMLRKAVVEMNLGRLNVEIITREGAKAVNHNFFDEISNRNFKRIETDKEFIYVQDSPELNNRDFTPSVTQSVPFGSGARVYKLQPGKIGGVKISQSGFGDASASSHASTQHNGANIADYLGPRNPQGDNQCQEKDNNENANCCQEKENNENINCIPEKPVYVVTTAERT